MYEIEIKTPKGILKFNLEKLEELEQHLPKDYTEVRATNLSQTKASSPNLTKKKKLV